MFWLPRPVSFVIKRNRGLEPHLIDVIDHLVYLALGAGDGLVESFELAADFQMTPRCVIFTDSN